MANPEVPGTPKIQVEVDTPFGPRIQSLEVDSNQIHPRVEFEYYWLKRLYPPARLPDVFLRAGMLVCSSAFVTSIMIAFRPPLAVLLMVAIPLLVLLFVATYSVRENQGLKLLLGGHVFLIILGIFIGGVL